MCVVSFTSNSSVPFLGGGGGNKWPKSAKVPALKIQKCSPPHKKKKKKRKLIKRSKSVLCTWLKQWKRISAGVVFLDGVTPIRWRPRCGVFRQPHHGMTPGVVSCVHEMAAPTTLEAISLQLIGLWNYAIPCWNQKELCIPKTYCMLLDQKNPSPFWKGSKCELPQEMFILVLGQILIIAWENFVEWMPLVLLVLLRYWGTAS